MERTLDCTRLKSRWAFSAACCVPFHQAVRNPLGSDGSGTGADQTGSSQFSRSPRKARVLSSLVLPARAITSALDTGVTRLTATPS